MTPRSSFQTFSNRLDYLQWLASPDCQPARRATELNVLSALARGDVVEFFCHAHQGNARLICAGDAVLGAGYYWRETGSCEKCGAITRVRLAAEWFHRSAKPADPRIYVTEQLTPLYKALREAFPDITGSEFTPDEAERIGASQTLAAYLDDPTAQIRHEDVCHLSFADESFDLVGSFDVLEHVPDYTAALREFRRVLCDGGSLLLTVPFLNAAPTSIVRARIDSGQLVHMETPEYHGNPTIAGEGVLCFYHFGWDLLDALRDAGFSSVALLDAWGNETALFGDQNAIIATR